MKINIIGVPFNGDGTAPEIENPEEEILHFLEWDEPREEQFGQDIRIILVSANFSKELTTSVLCGARGT